MFLFRLVYFSRNRVKELGNPVTKEMRAILDASTRNNLAAALTGGLIFNDHYFAQVIEGDRCGVTSMFCKIARDRRHSDLTLLEAKAVDQRLFTDWAMAYAGHSDAIDLLYLKHSVTIGFHPKSMSADSLTGFIRDLVRSDARVAHAPITHTADVKLMAEARERAGV